MANKKKAKTAKPKGGNPTPARKAATKTEAGNMDSIARLIDHPLVAELLAVGAMAAVASIADHNVKTRTGDLERGSGKAIKAACKAAAAAIGKRLMTEVDEVRKAAKPAKPAKQAKPAKA